jgi:DNA-directed RNA polymerase subunit RPC12/RpoP
MKKRLTFKCWNAKCKKTYTLFRELTDEQVIMVACPYCNAEAKVDLKPYRKKNVFRGENVAGQSPGKEFELPAILPTQQPE